MLQIILTIIITFIILAIILSFYIEKEMKKELYKRLESEFGKKQSNNFDERDYNSMKSYYKNKNLDYSTIDDITWADLDMDKLFRRIKNTQSSIGDEYLYWWLKHQKIDDILIYFDKNNQNTKSERLDSFENKINEMKTNSKIRLNIQYQLNKLGRLTNNGLVDLFLDRNKLRHLPVISALISNIILIITLIFCFMFYNTMFNYVLFILIFVVATSLVTSISHTEKYSKEYNTMDEFIKLIRSAKEISKLNNDPLDKELNNLKNQLNKIGNKNLLIITSLFDYVLNSKNIIFSIVISTFWFHIYAYRWLSKLIEKHQNVTEELYSTLGFIDCCISISSYRESLDYYCTPKFIDKNENENKVTFKNIIHPLLEKPVTNTDVIAEKIIITGSNASGKSTFTKSLALSIYLGQIINTSLCEELIFRPCIVMTSMNITDNISKGESHFIAEVKSINRILSTTNKYNTTKTDYDYPMIFLDEIFTGTNTVERVAAASSIMKKLKESDCFICLTTHDLEISQILNSKYTNYHFCEKIDEDIIKFDYKLKKGVVESSNAIRMMELYRIDKDIIEEAQIIADNYRNTNKWKSL